MAPSFVAPPAEALLCENRMLGLLPLHAAHARDTLVRRPCRFPYSAGKLRRAYPIRIRSPQEGLGNDGSRGVERLCRSFKRLEPQLWSHASLVIGTRYSFNADPPRITVPHNFSDLTFVTFIRQHFAPRGR